MKKQVLISSSIVIIIVILLSIVILTSKDTKYVNITFKIQDIMFDAKVGNDTKLTNSNPSCLNLLNYSSLYYDSEKKEKYNNETIDKDITIYVELEKKDYSNLSEEEMLLQIREGYLNQYVVPIYGREYILDGTKFEYNIDDVEIINYLGCYNDSYVILFNVSGCGVGWNTTKEYVIGGISLVFPHTANIPYVWHNGYFYFLETAYNQGLLTIDDLETISLIIKGEEK